MYKDIVLCTAFQYINSSLSLSYFLRYYDPSTTTKTAWHTTSDRSKRSLNHVSVTAHVLGNTKIQYI